MKTIIAVTFFLSLGMITAGSSALAQDAADFDAEELIRQIETQYQGKTSRTILRMKIITEAWSRDMAMESWSEGRDKFLAVIWNRKKRKE